MSSVFALLFLVSLVGLVWGLIAPHHVAKVAKIQRPVTRAHTGLGFGILILLFIILASVTAPSQQDTAKNANYTAKGSSQSNNTKLPSKGNDVSTKQVTETQNIPFTTQDVEDGSLPKGQTKVSQVGKNGVETITYKVTYINGKQTDKAQIASKATVQPINQIVEIGTYIAPAPAPSPIPAPAPSPSPAPAPSQGCYPLTNGGNCYEPGEYCRISDHGVTGVAGDGESIICANNDGWRWEPN